MTVFKISNIDEIVFSLRLYFVVFWGDRDLICVDWVHVQLTDFT